METTVPQVEQVLPDHRQLPDEDGNVASNFQEHPQSTLLSGCLRPRLRERFGDSFAVGCDSMIYYQYTQPPQRGAKAPDWFLVPGVPPLLDGEIRRSYVLWQEAPKPLLVIEYVSGDGSEEHDRTPGRGKFWAYETAISASFYVIFDRPREAFEVYCLVGGKYQLLPANAAGRVPVEPLGIEFGLWEGTFEDTPAVWLRAWDAAAGTLLPSPDERAEAERERAEAAEALVDDARKMRDEETERAEAERKRADSAEERARKLAARLRELGIDPDA